MATHIPGIAISSNSTSVSVLRTCFCPRFKSAAIVEGVWEAVIVLELVAGAVSDTRVRRCFCTRENNRDMRGQLSERIDLEPR